jgi:hypothetical protein
MPLRSGRISLRFLPHSRHVVVLRPSDRDARRTSTTLICIRRSRGAGLPSASMALPDVGWLTFGGVYDIV